MIVVITVIIIIKPYGQGCLKCGPNTSPAQYLTMVKVAAHHPQNVLVFSLFHFSSMRFPQVRYLPPLSAYQDRS